MMSVVSGKAVLLLIVMAHANSIITIRSSTALPYTTDVTVMSTRLGGKRGAICNEPVVGNNAVKEYCKTWYGDAGVDSSLELELEALSLSATFK